MIIWKAFEKKNWQREQMPRKWRERGSEEDRNCDGDCTKRDLERVEKEQKIEQQVEGIGDC